MNFCCIERNIVLEINKEILNDIFQDFDENIRIKKTTDRLNLGELQVVDISAKYTLEIQRNI